MWAVIRLEGQIAASNKWKALGKGFNKRILSNRRRYRQKWRPKWSKNKRAMMMTIQNIQNIWRAWGTTSKIKGKFRGHRYSMSRQ